MSTFSRGVTGSTSDFESASLSSNLGGRAEKLHTVTIEWAEHENWCPSFFKVIQCFNCGAMGKITDNANY